jgi:hypothetical protein
MERRANAAWIGDAFRRERCYMPWKPRTPLLHQQRRMIQHWQHWRSKAAPVLHPPAVTLAVLIGRLSALPSRTRE